MKGSSVELFRKTIAILDTHLWPVGSPSVWQCCLITSSLQSWDRIKSSQLRNQLELQECVWLTSWWSPHPSSTAASCYSGCLNLCDCLTFRLCSLTCFLFLILPLPGKASSVEAWVWGSCSGDILVDSSVWFSHSVMSDSLRPQGLQHTRLPRPSATPEACSNSCPSSGWCHPTISSSVIPFSCLQSCPASGSFPISQAKVLEFQLQHQSFQWIFWTDFLEDWLVGSPCNPRDSQESSPTPQFKSINSSALSFPYSPTLTSIHEKWVQLSHPHILADTFLQIPFKYSKNSWQHGVLLVFMWFQGPLESM